MLDLEPIPKAVQQRMFEKMKALREHQTAPNTNSTDELTFDKMATRSTFIKMVSNQKNPITLMGGMLKNNTLYAGYDAYSPREYKTGGGDFEEYTYSLEQNLRLFKDVPEAKGKSKEIRKELFDNQYNNNKNTIVNRNSRPMPGIQNIDVSFKGGDRSSREATISWMCWDWEELDELMPHFLAHGKTVLLEWGWVYDKNSLLNLPTFVDQNGRITTDAFTDIKDTIIQGRGDFDMMIGIVKNFEYTTNDDGGFNCQTILGSIGVNIYNNPQPNDTVKDPGITFNLNVNEDSEELVKKLEAATAGEETGNPADLLTVNTSLTLKLFVSKIDVYIAKQLAELWEDRVVISNSEEIVYKPGAFLGVGNNNQNNLRYGNLKNAWVRWGWFEDNVLSKFVNLTNSKGESITKFASIEKILSQGGESSGVYESVKIRNHESLETTDINNHILPGQFYPSEPRPIEVGDSTVTLSGDSLFLKELGKIVNNKDNFDLFTAKAIVRIRKVLSDSGLEKFNKQIYGEELGSQITENQTFTAPLIDEYESNYSHETTTMDSEGNEFTIAEGQPLGQVIGANTVLRDADEELTPEGYVSTDYDDGYTEDDYMEIEEVQSDSRFGYLRNMLINTKVIKEAFGVGEEFSVETVNIVEALNNLFNIVNQDLDFWSFETTTDQDDPSLAKIVDRNITALDFSDEYLKNEGMVSKQTTVDPTTNQIVGDEGIFYFPTWTMSSFTTMQNVNAKMPDELSLITMYGSNLDQISEFTNPGNAASDKEAVAAGSLYADEPEPRNENVNVAFINELKFLQNAGLDSDVDLGSTDGTVIKFLIDESDVLEEKYEDRLEKVNEKIRTAATEKVREQIQVDESIPIPPPRTLSEKEIGEILLFESTDPIYKKDIFGQAYANRTLTELLGSKFTNENKLKPEYMSSVGYLTTEHGINSSDKISFPIPIELELEIDGTGCIYPGNSYHSLYLPTRYQNLTVFQAFDVSHTVDSNGWKTAISGKMRTNMALVRDVKTTDEKIKEQLLNFKNKAKLEHQKTLDEKKLNDEDKQASKVSSAGIGTRNVYVPCWIAAELYGGWYEPRTKLARKFVNSSKFPKMLFNLYMKYGERTAKFIRKYKFMKLIFKPIFNWFVKMGKQL